MRDPFPIPASKALSSITARIFSFADVPILPLHIHEILIAAATYHVICFGISPVVSRALFPKTYPKFEAKTKLNWNVHMTSLAQSTMINAVGLWVLFYDEERIAMDWRDRVYGYDGALGMVAALATGYFLWDLWLCAWYVRIFGPGLLAHAFSALVVYFIGFRPVVMYYGPVFILFELSSPFLNFHWFFDKLQMTGSNAQLYNGIVLTTTFFGSRLVWGAYNCFRVFPELLRVLSYQKTPEGLEWLAEQRTKATIEAGATAAMDGDTDVNQLAGILAPRPLPNWIIWIIMASYVTLMVLNVVWFGKMIETIRARFEPPLGTKKVKKAEGGTIKSEISGGKTTLNDGTTVMELEETEVKQRKPRRKA